MGMIKLSKIKPNEKNPRFVKDEKFEKLCKSIEAFAEKMMPLRPIVIDENNIILGGNMRFKALKHLGYKEVPSDWIKQANDLTEEEKNEFIIKDNVGFGDWDWEVLANEWNSDELEEWGLDIPNFEPIEELEAVEDDYEEPEQMQVDVVFGDLIEIGEHRLLCGDSTDSDAVARLMNGEKADMVFTDPPYGMNLDTDYSEMQDDNNTFGKKESKKYDKVIGDNEDFKPELINTIFACFSDVKEVFIWGADYFAELIPEKNKGSWIVWDKRENADGVSNLDKMFGSAFELCWSKEKHKRELCRVRWAALFGTEKEHDKRRVHPTQKPSLLAQWFFNKWGKDNDLIADLFLGSGSTMVASHQLKRKCYGMELDPKYCQVIIDRMQKLDSSLVVKINGIEYKKATSEQVPF